MKTMPNTTDHTPGALKVFLNGKEVGDIVQSETFRCEGQIPSTPPLELLCERHAKARGYIW